MLIGKPSDMKSSEITDKSLYLNRRQFMIGTLAMAASATVFNSFISRSLWAGDPLSIKEAGKYNPGEKLTSLENITHYNNFYEFSTEKEDVARLAKDFHTRPWTVSVEGLVKKPQRFDIDQLIKLFPLEERIYRLRCVEGWSMVIPWMGFPLASLIKQMEPASQAKFVEFTTLYDPKQLPGQKRSVLKWPYTEGLRLDEAMHPLTLLAVGLYGETLPNQNGAPLRLVVPWKYGFKSIKSIVRIRLVADQPPTSWSIAAPNDYGFYSNVNPNVDHPRWSQARERRIGEFFKRKSLMFNGYEDQVAPLYKGGGLVKYF